MKNKRELKSLAHKIAKLERKCAKGKEEQDNQAKIEMIMSTLDFGEVIWIDNYIMKKNLLTK